VQLTLHCDSFGRVVGTIAHNGAHATVTSSDSAPAIQDLQDAVMSAVTHGQGECFWHEAVGDYRWLFRREGSTMRVAILWSIGTVTGWEHRFWAECDAEDFRESMRAAIESCEVKRQSTAERDPSAPPTASRAAGNNFAHPGV